MKIIITFIDPNVYDRPSDWGKRKASTVIGNDVLPETLNPEQTAAAEAYLSSITGLTVHITKE